MSQIKDILVKAAGRYVGRGINHEGQAFIGAFELTTSLNGRGFRVSFIATGDNGAVFQQEDSLIAPGLNEKWTLWNFNTNIPGVVPHELREIGEQSDKTSFVFAFGDAANKNSFRNTVTMSVLPSSRVSYLYSWGLPGGDFAERSGVEMSKISEPQ